MKQRGHRTPPTAYDRLLDQLAGKRAILMTWEQAVSEQKVCDLAYMKALRRKLNNLRKRTN